MRISRGVAAVVLALTVAVLVVGAVVAHAQQGVSFSATYVGVGTGTSDSGEEGSSPVIVWMIERPSGVEYTAEIQEIGMAVDAAGPVSSAGADSFAAPLTVTSRIAHGSGQVTVENEGGALSMLLSGTGGARGYEGQGTFVGQAQDLPRKSLGEQVTEMAQAVGGAPQQGTVAVPPTATPVGSATTTPGLTESGNPVSRPLRGDIVNAPEPPMTAEEIAFGASIGIFLIFLWAFISLFFTPDSGAWEMWDQVMNPRTHD